jgi:hypothetical protein
MGKKEEITAEDSFTDLLEKERQMYQGHPASEKTDKEESKEKESTEESKEKESEESEEKETKESTEKRESIEESEEKETKKSEEEEESDLDKKIEERFSKRLHDTQEAMHDAKTENARLREQVDSLNIKITDLLTTLVKKPDDSTQTHDDLRSIETQIETMLENIEKLDTSDPDYRKKVSAQYKNVFEERDRSLRTSFKKDMDEVIETRLKREREEREKKEAESNTSTLAIRMAMDSGLEMKENSPDWDLFWAIAPRAKGDTAKEAIDNAIKETKRLKSALGAPVKTAQEKAEKRQKESQILERHGSGKASDEKTPPSPMNISDALRVAQEKRKF